MQYFFWLVSAIAGVAAGTVRMLDRRARSASPWAWVALLALGAPWVRIELGEAVVYPGHWLVATLLGVAWLRTLFPRGRNPLPLKGPLLLCGFLSLMLLLRGEWSRLAALAGASAANLAWAWGAYRWGRLSERSALTADGVVLFVVAGLGLEAVLWLLAGLWPPACLALNCPPWPHDPPLFRGGMISPAQFALTLALVLPAFGAPFVLAWRTRPARGPRRVLIALAALMGVGALAGGGPWLIPLGAVLLLGLARTLAPWHEPRDLALLKRMTVWMAVVPVLFFAVFPGYVTRWFTDGAEGWGRVRIEHEPPVERRLSSRRTTAFALRVTNAGGIALPDPVRIVPQLLITPARGETRVHDLAPFVLHEGLPARESARVSVPVRLPHWVRDGYLSWQVRVGGGGRAVLTEDSSLGLRFVNADFETLDDSADNLLSALAARAQDYHRSTRVPERYDPGGANLERVLGDSMDTLLFSPLWGESKQAEAAWRPFPPFRPFLAQLFAEFGLIGLLLVLRLGWVAARRADAVGLRANTAAQRLAWQLVPVSLLMVAALALFSPVLGSYHAQWGLFLLIGFVEGRSDRLFPPRPPGPWPGLAVLRAFVPRLLRFRFARRRPRRVRRRVRRR